MIKAVFLDLDGTLLTTEKKVSDYTMSVLKRANKKGIHIVPCSGRRRSDIEGLLGEEFPAKYLIGSNGAVIYDRETAEYIHCSAFSLEDAAKVIAFAKEHNAFCGCIQGESLILDAEFADQFPERLSRLNVTVLSNDLTSELKKSGEPVTKITVTRKGGSASGEEKLMEQYRKLFPNLSVTTSVLRKGLTDEHVEIGSDLAEKSYAMIWLCEKLGISIEETAAFGDSPNDLSMLKAAGKSFVMENAGEEMKAYADHIAGNNDADGVAKAMEAFLMN